jgi:hypothetical protein
MPKIIGAISGCYRLTLIERKSGCELTPEKKALLLFRARINDKKEIEMVAIRL